MYGAFILQGAGTVSLLLHFHSVTITLECYVVTQVPTSSNGVGDDVAN